MFFLIIIGFMVLSMLAGLALRNRFNAYAKVPLRSGLSGREVAEKMLRENGLYDVQVTCVQGTLTDHYNPMNRTVNLSPDVYSGRSVAAAAVAAHECGHAVQHATAYPFLQFRSAMVPMQNASARILNVIIMVMMFGGMFLFKAFPFEIVLLTIIACQGVITLFSVITLPVEFDASNRALSWLNTQGGVMSGNVDEHEQAKDALWWAAMTYVVAALGSLATLLYYASMLFNRRD